MKKIVYSALFFTGISALFGLCYYLSFKHALVHYNQETVEQNTRLLQEILQYSGENERLLRQLAKEEEPMVPVSVAQETLSERADYFLETYYVQSNHLEREQLALPGFMVGTDIKALTAYLEDYMDAIPVNEYLKGLISYEIISFQSSQVVLRKTYDEAIVKNQFYVCKRGDFVVVYYSDLKTIYEYTEIRIDSLPENIRVSVEEGFYVKDAKELYCILEGYTS